MSPIYSENGTESIEIQCALSSKQRREKMSQNVCRTHPKKNPDTLPRNVRNGMSEKPYYLVANFSCGSACLLP